MYTSTTDEAVDLAEADSAAFNKLQNSSVDEFSIDRPHAGMYSMYVTVQDQGPLLEANQAGIILDLHPGFNARLKRTSKNTPV